MLNKMVNLDLENLGLNAKLWSLLKDTELLHPQLLFSFRYFGACDWMNLE